MLGAVIGDMIGSPYEFINMYSRRKVKPFEHTLRGRCQFTDDTVLSMAVAMRIVPVGWLYSSLEDTLRIAKIATERTHNSKEAIEGAQMIAAAVFMSRKGESKAAIKCYAEQTFGYRILEGEEGLEQLRENSRKYRRKKIASLKLGEFINCDTKLSVEEALFAFLHTSNFKDCIRTAVAIGGDSDTIACMSGGIAEAFYGDVPADWKYKAAGVLADGHCKMEDIEMVMNFREYIT